jgi:predicted peptidase
MFRKISAVYFFILIGLLGFAAEPPAPSAPLDPNVQGKRFESGNVRVNYALYLPKAYKADGPAWPLIVFLHGAGSKGDDLKRMEKTGPLTQVVGKDGRDLPFIIVAPLCPNTKESWSSSTQLAALDALHKELISKYNIDQNRVYLTGLSLGGSGTWAYASEHPHRFAAILMVSGYGNPKNAIKLSHLPIWLFHGAKDTNVPMKSSEAIAEALKTVGNPVEFTIIPEGKHDIWGQVYGNPAIYEWMLKHKRQP